ncbi:unnamed protein product [Phaeothamnion confervicola]
MARPRCSCCLIFLIAFAVLAAMFALLPGTLVRCGSSGADFLPTERGGSNGPLKRKQRRRLAEGNGALAPRKRARMAYFIMAGGASEVRKLKRMLPVIYSEDNYYLVHLDRKTALSDRENLRAYLGAFEKGNAMLLEPALTVSWGGFSITLAAIFGLASAVQWFPEWDYFINLSASDFPLLTQPEIAEVLGAVKDHGVSFVKGAPLEPRFERRVTRYIDDQGLYRDKFTRQPMNPLRTGVFKGEFWVVLHRSYAEYLTESPDNVARMLMTYFSKFRISDESYFQTVACHPSAPESTRICGDYLRQINWPQLLRGQTYRLHPKPISADQVFTFLSSGALFARKFDLEVPASAAAMDRIEELLKDSSRSAARVERSLARINNATEIIDRSSFCNSTGEWVKPAQI